MITASGSLVLPLAESTDVTVVGGKAINLSRLLAAGFTVPGGFVITTHAFKIRRGQREMPRLVSDEIAAAYRELGSPVVAVRSSATAEDLAGASMAGQYETYLDISGEDAVLAAVERCWGSLDSPRTRSYLAKHGIDPAEVGMAVVVQVLVHADVAGVLFTVNPRSGVRGEMLVEASWGLGESVVSGKVQPDTLTIDSATGSVSHCAIGSKQTWIKPGTHAELPVPLERRGICSLKPRDVRQLWQLGITVMEHFGSPQDIEWAMSGGRLYLLQSRAVTTLADAEAAQACIQRTRAQLRAELEAGRGGWVRHNLAETLTHPTPLSWSLIQRFMSGSGGFGSMYRRIGFEPSPRAYREGFLELIAGRVYMDLKRGPEMFLEGFPFAYDLAKLRSNADAAQQPPTLPIGSLKDRVRAGRRLAGVSLNIAEVAVDLDRRLDLDLIPAFRAWVDTERQRDLATLDTAAWIRSWQEREAKVLDEFAPWSLLPSVIAVWSLDQLRTFLAEHFWDEDPESLANQVAAGESVDRTLAANHALFELAHGDRTLESWLNEFGHRATDEFDLSSPRWSERPEAVRAMAEHLRGGVSPMALHRRRSEAAQRRMNELVSTLSAGARVEFKRLLDLVLRYLRFREDGKYHLMRGYALMRDLALEAGRRLEVGEDIFLLTFEEVRDALGTGFAPMHLIAERRIQRRAESKCQLPTVIDHDDVSALGEPPPLLGGDRIHGFPISSGSSSGSARIVASPESAGELGKGYVLVCSSTDPSWTPLFINAAGLVMECGGSLSHGAVVAREMGIPAVVVAGATKRFSEGELLSIDGHRGVVMRVDVDGEATEADSDVDPMDTRIAAAALPPPPGAKERRGTLLRNWGLLIWGVYLVATFLLQEPWVYRPSMAVLDSFLIPLMASVGKPMTVAVIAFAVSAITMITQRLLTDNARLLVGSRRAALLKREADRLPPGTPRRQALLAAIRPLRSRVTMAAFVPLALLLGPMVMTFMWFPERVDPASWNPEPGAIAYVIARVDGECGLPVTARFDTRLRLDGATAATQSIPPIRSTLVKLRERWSKPSNLEGQPWEVRAAAERARTDLMSDLDGFLARRMPDQELAWTVVTPDHEGGRFAVEVTVPGCQPTTIDVVTGSSQPPAPTVDLLDGRKVPAVVATAPSSPIRSVRVGYKEDTARKVFWQPLASFGWHVELGWLWTYLIVYVPVMFLFRWLLRLA